MSKASDWAIKKLKGHFNKPTNKSKVSEITKAAKAREDFYKQYSGN